jgi:diketogulonate reductase-like aldo/keto reductase
MQTLTLPNGSRVPKLGLGTWGMGERRGEIAAEIRAISHALNNGITLLDTAEMYGEGGAEEVIGIALKGLGQRPYLVSKVYPNNASRSGLAAACERSLKRLQVDHIDLYLLHWRGNIAFEETIEGFERLVGTGKIGAWGVSNMDAGDLTEIWSTPGGDGCQTNQVLYNLSRRWPEDTLMPVMKGKKMPVMAYSPLEQGLLAEDKRLKFIAKEAGMAPLDLALAWVVSQENVFGIPKSVLPERIDGFLRAVERPLSHDLLEALNLAFPPPIPGSPIEML